METMAGGHSTQWGQQQRSCCILLLWRNVPGWPHIWLWNPSFYSCKYHRCVCELHLQLHRDSWNRCHLPHKTRHPEADLMTTSKFRNTEKLADQVQHILGSTYWAEAAQLSWYYIRHTLLLTMIYNKKGNCHLFFYSFPVFSPNLHSCWVHFCQNCFLAKSLVMLE